MMARVRGRIDKVLAVQVAVVLVWAAAAFGLPAKVPCTVTISGKPVVGSTLYSHLHHCRR